MKPRSPIKTRYPIAYNEMQKNKSLDQWADPNDISLCSGCSCMTKTIDKKCGKCGGVKSEEGIEEERES